MTLSALMVNSIQGKSKNHNNISSLYVKFSGKKITINTTLFDHFVYTRRENDNSTYSIWL